MAPASSARKLSETAPCSNLPRQSGPNLMAAQALRGVITSLTYAATLRLGLQRFRSRWAQTSVGRVRVLEYRSPTHSGPTWVFVHGFASQATDWAPLLNALRPHCGRILAIDLPGHGRSPVPAQGLTPSGLLRGGIEAIGKLLGPKERVVLVGNSMGGLGVVRVTQTISAQVAGLVLISPAGAPHTPTELEALLQLFQLQTPRDGFDFVDRLYIHGVKLRALMAWGAWAHLGRAHLQGLLQAYRTYPTLTRSELQTLPETLLFCGQGDLFLPASSARWYRDNLPRQRTTFIQPAGCGHTPFLDTSHLQVAQSIIEWAQPHSFIA